MISPENAAIGMLSLYLPEAYQNFLSPNFPGSYVSGHDLRVGNPGDP